MITIKSSRALKLLETLPSFTDSPRTDMRRYSREGFAVAVGVEWEGNNVKKLSFSGNLEPADKIILESLSMMMKGKSLSLLDNLSLRECEAFLRDRNSEVAIEGLDKTDEEKFKNLFSWLRHSSSPTRSETYSFSNEKGPFRRLKIVDKITALKEFFASKEVAELYQNLPRPELIDLDDLTVYVQVPYQEEKEKSLFEELHFLGVKTFSEQELNFIPEA